MPSVLDDFNNAVLVKRVGANGYISYLYEKWSGRYTLGIIVAYFNPLNYSSWPFLTRVAPLAYYILLLLSFYYLFSALNAEKKEVLSISILSVFLYATPIISELFYWFTGAATYTSGMIFSLIFLGSVIKYFSLIKTKKKYLFLFIAMISLVAAIGTNESTLMALVFITFVFLLFCYVLQSKGTLLFLLFFLCAITAAIFSITAPGNTVRTSLLHGADNFLNLKSVVSAVVKAIYFSIINFVSWINNLALIIASIVIPFASSVVEKNLWLKKVTSIHPLICLFFTIIFLAVQAFPSYLGSGDIEPRVWSSIYFFFLLSWLLNCLVLKNFFRPWLINVDHTKTTILKVVLPIILLFSAQGNINLAYQDLFLRASQYSASLNERYRLIQSSKNMEVIVEPIDERYYKIPKSIYVMDISTDPLNPGNKNISEYFNLESIRLSKEPVR